MTDLNAILEQLRQNEEISKKFHEIETRILTILNFRDLFEVLLTEIREKFRVPYAWISMIDKSEVSGLIQSLESSEILREHMSRVDRDTFLKLVGATTKPLLVNDDLTPYFKLLPQTRRFFIKSIAIAPISLDGEIIGSLNQADFSQKRFQPDIDTSLLEQLALKVSLCLSNVTAHEKLRFLAYHDPLTGLLNRRVMETVLKREFSRSIRYSNPLSVVFLDIDDFKSVNDLHGHDRGDDMLKYVAGKLVKMSRDSDVVSRFAGDEFVLILPETTARSAEKLMSRIRAYFVENPLKDKGVPIPISVSFGVASTEDKSIKDITLLLKEADKMLYRAKTLKKEGSSPKELAGL